MRSRTLAPHADRGAETLLRVFSLCAALVPDAGLAALAFPAGASQTAQIAQPMSTDIIATGPFRDGAVPTRAVQGNLTRTAWRIRGTDAPTLQLLLPLRAQLMSQGFRPLYECESDACGGFDFRYALTVLPEPEMHVDLGDFRYVAVEKPTPSGSEIMMLIVSRSNDTAFVQVTEVKPYDPQAITLTVSSKSPEPAAAAEASVLAGPPAQDTFETRIDSAGAVSLDDLIFATGSAELGPGTYPSLTALAAYLASRPDRAITLVGHTDAAGALAANVALSKRRAQSVVDRLVSDYGASAGQLSAEGVGFLAPRSSNLTAEGRTENRRVEAMLTSTR